ncbi:hypothetical protein [Helicobacter macacae]|uniref:Uncharacterized protein n=1 Tax=Helicobacter macacae MIT 99-5501 TaxID=1357400 RepID=V8C8A2_9HELI|nr:hypothetical protein [Helicobacter macacae]ETD23260.1 hypothetical protein HMPREF2086_01059 [Helicobacter macacae MIT 99-5501]
MSFSEAFRSRVFLAIGIAFVVGLLVFVCSDDEEAAAFNALVAFFLGFFIAVLILLFAILSTKCPKCKKYLCFKEYKHEDLSRDVVSKKVKDNELGTKLEHYAVGKRKHYYECDKCGYESTSIRDYKDKIDV